MLLRSRYPLEAWLEAGTRSRTPTGIDTSVRRVPHGQTLALRLPKEPIPYYVHAIVEFAGREPRFVAETRRTRTEVHERYEFAQPSVLFVHKWVEERFFDAAADEPCLRNVLYVCASDAQIARAQAVIGELNARATRLPGARRVARVSRL